MRKDIALPALALVGGVAGFLLRLWQRASALDPATQLFDHRSPATPALIALVLTAALLTLVLSRKTPPISQPNEAFFCPSSLYMTLMVASAMAFLMTGALGLPQLSQDLQAWRFDPVLHPMPIALALSLAGCLAAAAGAMIMGRNNYRGITGNGVRPWTTLPAYAALPWLILTYQTYSRDPILLNVFIPVLACVCLLLALYHQAAFFYGRPRPDLFFCFSTMGMILGITALADPQPRFSLLLTAAYVLCNFGGMVALSSRAFGLSRPAPSGGQPTAEAADNMMQPDISNE